MSKTTIVFLIVLVLFFFSLSACKNNIQGANMTISRDQDYTGYFLEKKIYFGHRSVGNNIVTALQNFKENHGFSMEISSISNATSNINQFIHSGIGENYYAERKIDDFKKNVENLESGGLDAAFMKLCYVDIDYTTDIDALFNKYVQTIEYLKGKYPETNFIHFTVPLVSSKLDLTNRLKNIIRPLLKKRIVRMKENVQREKYNEKIRNRYSKEGSIFDIAIFESTSPDGSEYNKKIEGMLTRVMDPAYTEDGGHLNTFGSEYIASELLLFLKRVLK